jgi:hypothetical protein
LPHEQRWITQSCLERHSIEPTIDNQTETFMRIIAIAFCLALLPGVASAQKSLRSAATGPTIQSAAVGFRANTDNDLKLQRGPIRRGAGQDVAMMVVGVAAMVAGAIIGDTAGTIVLIGGAAMALYGLYNYLE